MPGYIGDIPSIVATQILSYLDWNEKLYTIQAISPWKPHLHTSAAWPAVNYGKESEENIYFVKEKRTNFLICIKLYGKYMRDVVLSFGYKIGHSGLQILHAIAERCPNLQKFHLTPSEVGHHNLRDGVWTKSCVMAYFAILRNCKNLCSVGIISPYFDWSLPLGNNLLLVLCNLKLAHKMTHLELDSNSLIEHEGYLSLLQQFTGLQKLTVRREKINNAILMTLVENNLQEITLTQDEELPLVDSQQLNMHFWEEVLKIKPLFKVDLILRYIMVIKDSFVPNMPLRSLVLDDLVNIVTKGVMDHLVTNYKRTLESFTYTNSYLENFESGDSRLPGALVSMVTNCEHLHTVQYGFPLSSTTILLIAKARKLQQLVIPSVEVSYEFDWPVQESWGGGFIEWLKTNCRSESLLESAMSSVLGYEWKLHYESLAYQRELDASYL